MGHNGKTHILRNESWMNLPVFADKGQYHKIQRTPVLSLSLKFFWVRMVSNF